MNSRKSIVTQTVFRVSYVFIVVLILFILAFTWFTGTYMKNHILENQQEQIEIVADSLETRLNGVKEMAVLLANYQPTIALLAGYYEPYTANWMENIRNLDNYLQNVNLFTGYIEDVNLVTSDSETLYSLRDVLRSDYPYTEQEWFRQALEREGVVKYAPPHGRDHLYRDNIGETFSLIYPVHHSRRLIGYEIIECSLYGIADFLEESGKESDYILLDEQNQVLHGDTRIMDSSKFMQDIEDTEEGQYGICEENGRLSIVYRLKANEWVVILESDGSVLWSPVKTLLFVVAGLVVLAACFLAAINLHHIRVMRRPFYALIDRINSYDGTGAESLEEYRDAPLELAVIGERFEEMAGKINTLINEVYVAQLQQKEAELEALINQINPHFLYNVFQLIQTKAVLSDNQEIEDMIQALSRMMRYTMDRKKDKVRISDEFDYIRDYLMFYKERFPRLFVCEISGEARVSRYRVLKFILQPVVENCFKHAFKDRKTGGIIRITADETGDDLIFEVWDNGCGMPPERLDQIRQKLEGALDESGIGIVNTNARIRLVYGEQYGIRVQSQEGEYTKVILKIKKED